MGKGSHRRPEDTEAFRSNYDRIFRKPVDEETQDKVVDLFFALADSLKRGPRCRDPKNCTGSCRRDPACNE